MLRHFKLLGALLAIILFAVSGTADAATDWHTNTIRATGTGVANPAKAVSAAHASMLARRAAVADAYRQLLEVVQGVNVDAETTVEQMMTASDVIKLKVTGVIKGAQIVLPAAAILSPWKCRSSARTVALPRLSLNAPPMSSPSLRLRPPISRPFINRLIPAAGTPVLSSTAEDSILNPS